jgi:hypothetical protein
MPARENCAFSGGVERRGGLGNSWKMPRELAVTYPFRIQSHEIRCSAVSHIISYPQVKSFRDGVSHLLKFMESTCLTMAG